MGVRRVAKMPAIIIDDVPVSCCGFSLDRAFGKGSGKIDIDIGTSDEPMIVTYIGFDIRLQTDETVFIHLWPHIPTPRPFVAAHPSAAPQPDPAQ